MPARFTCFSVRRLSTVFLGWYNARGEQRMTGRAHIGTSGWNYGHWVGVFYPPKLKQSEWLRFYSARFDTVEINNSFYRLPGRKTFEAWRSQTPEGFTFAVKASRFLTHMKKLKDPEEPVSRLFEAAGGLGDKLSVILYQLPPYWKANAERLEGLLKLLPTTARHVFEFRDDSWHNDEIYGILSRYGAGYCIMSAPDLPCNLVTTADFSYVRMHNGGEATEGCYTDADLRRWAAIVSDLLTRGDAYVYFNNDYRGYAVANALKLREELAGA